jgi:Flp pilus assembly protein TadD
MGPGKSSIICPACGRPAQPGEECPQCLNGRIYRFAHRELILVFLLAVIAVAAYFGTRAFADANRRMHLRTASWWYREGEAYLQEKQPEQAIIAFRRASVNDRDNRLYAGALAQALQTAGKDKEATELLRQLRDAAPEDPGVNVELGRIAGREDDVRSAIRYYHNALYGIWQGDNIDARRTQVRRELIEFLISNHAHDQALAEILALRSHLDNEPASYLELGRLFLRAGDAQRAFAEFRDALRQEPHSQAALAGAGEAAFAAGDYSHAHRYLSEVATPAPAMRSRLDLATLVLQHDPVEPRLTGGERYQRLVSDVDAAARRLQPCRVQQLPPAKATPLETAQDKLDSLQPLLTPENFKSDPNLSFSALEVVYEAEQAAAGACGEPQGIDMALLLIGQKYRRGEP